MILQLRKIKADSGKTPDDDVNDGNEHLIDGDNYDVTHDDGVDDDVDGVDDNVYGDNDDVTHDDGVDDDVDGVVNQVVSQGC